MASLISGHKCVCNECKINSTDSKSTGRGKETTFRILNKSGKIIDKYIVDDCLLKKFERSKKCDYLFNVQETNVVFLVECKGSDILEAVEQIQSSLNLLNKYLVEKIVKGRIVSTKVYSPNIKSRKYSQLREKLSGGLVTQNIVLEETI